MLHNCNKNSLLVCIEYNCRANSWISKKNLKNQKTMTRLVSRMVFVCIYWRANSDAPRDSRKRDAREHHYALKIKREMLLRYAAEIYFFSNFKHSPVYVYIKKFKEGKWYRMLNINTAYMLCKNTHKLYFATYITNIFTFSTDTTLNHSIIFKNLQWRSV